MINETITQETAKAIAYSSSNFIIWASVLIIFFIITLIFKSKNTNWGRFLNVWIFTAIISGVLLFFVNLYPEKIIKFIDWLKSIFGI